MRRSIFLLVLLGCGGREQSPEQVLRPVRYERVFATGGDRVRIFSGVASSAAETPLSFRVAGTVSGVFVSVGERVATGTRVASIDPSDYELQLQEAQASLRRLQAERRNAESAYSRVRALYENNNASQNDLEAARTAFESATAGVQQTEARIELLQRQVGYASLTAPRSGEVTNVNIEVGQNVGVGQTVVEIASGTALEVEVGIPDVLISALSVGDPATVRFSADPDRDFDARITEVSPTADFTSTYPVTLQLLDASPDLRPGMAAEIRIAFRSGTGESRYVVPTVAVGEDAMGRYVMVLEPAGDGTAVASRRSVTVGDLVTEGVVIQSGIADGEYIATAGVPLIADGMTVAMHTVEAATQ